MRCVFVGLCYALIMQGTAAQTPAPPQRTESGLPQAGDTPVNLQHRNVTTYHYDNLRTGWNSHEETLTVAGVNAQNFGWIRSVALDDQVDAQPLIMTSRTIAGLGTRDVVYIATESNTLYAIDAASGDVLLTRNLGHPVPKSNLPGHCDNNGPNVGINSTPVIDAARNLLYVVTYTSDDQTNNPTYTLHALDVNDLSDKLPPATIMATQTLTDGSVYHFTPRVSRQRSALLSANGNIYVAFASFCDMASDVSRGWLLGWNGATLLPLGGAQLNDRVASSASHDFLSSIWMSGYGVAADRVGNLFFVTGNSDTPYAAGASYSDTYDPPKNLQESVVKMSSDLTEVLDWFTPSDSKFGKTTLDQKDFDLGAGGVMLLPDQSGAVPYLATVAGKVGPMYLLDRDHLGRYSTSGTNDVIGSFNIGVRCFCGQSYFEASDGSSRVVSSGGDNAILWKVDTTSSVTLVEQSASAAIPTAERGFFTTVSSNARNPGTSIIWAVSRPMSINSPDVSLYAFDGDSATTIFSGTAGSWPNVSGNANIVPMVANGKVYVASYKELAIFGLGGHARIAPTVPVITAAAKTEAQHVAALAETPEGNKVSGVIVSIKGNQVTLRTRSGRLVHVDASDAQRKHLSVELEVGIPVKVLGVRSQGNTVKAKSVLHAQDLPALWEPDR